MRYRVAALWGCSVRELGKRMPASEWPLWCEFYSREPWGFQAADVQRAQLAATIWNASGHMKKAVQPKDLLTPPPSNREEPAEMTPEETDAYLMRVLG